MMMETTQRITAGDSRKFAGVDFSKTTTSAATTSEGLQSI